MNGLKRKSNGGAAYAPPHKSPAAITAKKVDDGVEYQKAAWEALRKSINGLLNKVTAANIKNVVPELLSENLVRGRGLFCRSCIKSQAASPAFTHVFAAVASAVNSKFPEIGNLLLRRVVLHLRRAYRRGDKPRLMAAAKFVAHLVNQQVAHEIVALELLTLLLENPTDGGVEVAVGFATECGSLLREICPRGLDAVFERLRGILHEGEFEKRVQFLIEGLFALPKAEFRGYCPAVPPELDLVEDEDRFTHEVSLMDEIDGEDYLDVFRPEPEFVENEEKYEEIKKGMLGGIEESESESEADDEDGEEEEEMRIRDETGTDSVDLRRTIYLTIMSSLGSEDAGHRLSKIKIEAGQEMEVCTMLLECCSQERSYRRSYGFIGQRLCMMSRVYRDNLERCFVQQYAMVHRLDTNRLRNLAKLFGHLLSTGALPWDVLAYIRLTEEDTTSSSRIFLKILFQELAEHLGIRCLYERLSEAEARGLLDDSIFPKYDVRNTRFAINFFTSIGLGGITENLRSYLKKMQQKKMRC